MSPARRKLGRRRGGSTVLEAALVINVVLMIILGVFEYGRIIMTKQLMDNAASQAARTAVVSTNTNPPTTTAMIQSQVNTYLAGLVPNPTTLVYQPDPNNVLIISSNNWNAATFGSGIAVRIDADYHPMIPTTFGILPNPLHLRSISVMRSEAN